MSAELRLGDCIAGMAGLPDKSVDCLVTDPPYRRDLYLSFRTNKGARGRDATSKQSRNHLALSNLAIGAMEDILEPAALHMARLARRWIVVFHDAESGHLWRTAFGPLYVRAGVWVKTNPVPQISGDRPAQGFECLTIAHANGAKRWNGGGRPAVWIANALNANPDVRERTGNDHPCPKPLDLMERLVRDFTDPGELVCDPFAGSFTTAVACKRLGRNFIGWEINPEWHAAGVRRVEAAREQYELLPRGPKPKQAALL